MSLYVYEKYCSQLGELVQEFDFRFQNDVEILKKRYAILLLEYWSLKEVKTYFQLKDTTAKKLKKAVVDFLKLEKNPRKLNKRHFFKYLNLHLEQERKTLKQILDYIEGSI